MQTLTDSHELAAVYRLRANAPGFGICLYRMEGGNLAATTMSLEGDQVSEFNGVNTEGGVLCTPPRRANGEAYCAAPGDPYLYAFQKFDLSIVVGTREEIVAIVKTDLPKLRNHPFLWSECAEFVGDSVEADLAKAACAILLKRK